MSIRKDTLQGVLIWIQIEELWDEIVEVGSNKDELGRADKLPKGRRLNNTLSV